MNLTNDHWCCPHCTTTAVSAERPFHTCPGLKGLEAPMVQEGVAVKVATHEREDYVGAEQVQTDGEGRPIMSVTVTRDDGEDCVVYAGTARAQVNVKDLG